MTLAIGIFLINGDFVRALHFMRGVNFTRLSFVRRLTKLLLSSGGELQHMLIIALPRKR